MKDGTRAAVQHACAEFLLAATEFYGLPKPDVRALASHPLRVREGGWAIELFGDYSPTTGLIRIPYPFLNRIAPEKLDSRNVEFGSHGAKSHIPIRGAVHKRSLERSSGSSNNSLQVLDHRSQ